MQKWNFFFSLLFLFLSGSIGKISFRCIGQLLNVRGRIYAKMNFFFQFVVFVSFWICRKNIFRRQECWPKQIYMCFNLNIGFDFKLKERLSDRTKSTIEIKFNSTLNKVSITSTAWWKKCLRSIFKYLWPVYIYCYFNHYGIIFYFTYIYLIYCKICLRL